MFKDYLKTIIRSSIILLSFAVLQPAFAIGEPQFGNAWIKGSWSGLEGNSLPGAGPQATFEVTKEADATSFGTIVPDEVTLRGSFYAEMKKGYVGSYDVGYILLSSSNVKDEMSGHLFEYARKIASGTFAFSVQSNQLPLQFQLGIIAACNDSSRMSNGASYYDFPVAIQFKGYRFKRGNTSANKRRDKVIRGFVRSKVFCTSFTHNKAPEKPYEIQVFVKKLGKARTCPRRIEVRTRIKYENPATAKFRFVHNGKQTGIISIKARKIVEHYRPTPQSPSKRNIYLVERVKFYNVGPGDHTFNVFVRGSAHPKAKTIKVGCGPFKPSALWMTLSQQKKASCPKNVKAKIRITANRPGNVLTKIKNQAGVVMAIESIRVKRVGNQYLGRLTKTFKMGEIETQLIAEDSNNSNLNSGWQHLKVTCLKPVKGTLSYQGADFGRCPRTVKVAFSIRTSINGRFKYRVDCTGGRAWAGKMKAKKTGPNTYLAVGVKSFSIKKHEKVSCALKSIVGGKQKILTVAGHSFSCDQGASDDLTVAPDPTHDEPKRPSGFVADPLKCKANERRVRGRCVRIVIDCKRGFKLVNGRCVKQPIVCKRNERLVRGKCVRIVIDCKRGFKLVNGRCVKQPIKCKPYEKRVRGKCVKKPIRIVCKKGYIRKGKKCVRKPVIGIKCKSGERRVGKRCVCKPSFKRVRGRCIKPAKRVKPKAKTLKLNNKALKRKIRKNKRKAKRRN